MDSLEKLIPTINKLQEVISLINSPHNLSLPQIVVVGPQSSGKSSVLESLVGRDFLPRGSGIVTRRPLVLRLIHINEREEWGEFNHKPDTKFKDFKLILAEIENATRQVAGTMSGISNDPIYLTINSYKVVDITLVDLPGLTKVAVGDQPYDIEAQIREMIMNFVCRPETIILAVSNANMDLANSDSLKISREVDPEGNRTLGVLTKIDLMDKGTNALDMLNGRIYPLKLGYVGVVCRSQQDIMNKKPIEKQFIDEKTFFRTHPAYASVSDRMGIPYLSTRLNQLLIKHIKESLPQFKENLSKMLKSSREELASYGEGLDGNYEKMSNLILKIIETFSTIFRENIEGSTDSVHEASLGAKIKEILFKCYKESINRIDIFDNLTDEMISTAIKNTLGIRSSLFIPEQAFEMLTKKLILRLRDPSLVCLNQVLDELKKALLLIKIKEFEVYPNLGYEMNGIVDEMLGRYSKPAQDMIENIIKVESSYINIEHPDFIGGSKVMLELDGEDFSATNEEIHSFLDKDKAFSHFTRQTTQGDDEGNKKTEKKNVWIIKRLIESYFEIVRKNVRDAVPKTIMSFLVNKAKNSIHTELVSIIYKESKIFQLLSEPEGIQEKRKKCRELLRGLERANLIINELRNIS